jgi:hypothetical protein
LVVFNTKQGEPTSKVKQCKLVVYQPYPFPPVVACLCV